MSLSSGLLRAKVLSHGFDMNEAVASRVDFFHKCLDLLSGHLATHVGHVLLELRHGNAIILIAVKVSQLFHHILRRVLVLQLVLHDELEALVSDIATVLRVNLLTHDIKLIRIQVEV